jgi:ABC-2 type transport system ATP-binding protein
VPGLEPSRTAMHSIILDSVHKVFRPTGLFFPRRNKTETYALKGISLNISRGEVFALLGPNGSGKSTTLKLISTVLLPDRGVILVNGADTRREARRVRQQVGFALASERSFFPRLTVRENLAFFAALEDVPRREIRDRIERVLTQVELDVHARKQAMKLSSGLQQRLGIARALVKQPRVLLLDEPTRSLDPVAAEHLWALVCQLTATGITVLLATHNFSEAAAVADHIAVLQKGELRGVRRMQGMNSDQLRTQYMEMTGEWAVNPWREEVPA